MNIIDSYVIDSSKLGKTWCSVGWASARADLVGEDERRFESVCSNYPLLDDQRQGRDYSGALLRPFEHARTFAVGDDYNDEALLAWACQSAVVAGAPEALRARFIEVADKDRDGVIEAIERFGL